MKKITDLSPYTNILPYASEIFGVYQPMLGWRSKKIIGRIEKGFAADLSHAFASVYKRFRGRFEFLLNEDRSLGQIRLLEPASLDGPSSRATGSFVVDSIARELPPLAQYDDSIWDNLIQAERLKQTLIDVVVPRSTEWHKSASERERRTGRGQTEQPNELMAEQLNRESALAGYLLYLKDHNHIDKLKNLFYKPDRHLDQVLRLLTLHDPLELLDPFKDIDRASLSPIGIVHLFRQYFFEFDTFLGTPVSHVWLSPGATVELLEISTRKTITERTFESTVETAVKTEKSLTEEDELADAVKEENKSDTKFGMSTTATQSWVSGSATATASFDIAATQSKAREESHRHMRQQTEKLSTEIRKNYKSTFKTVTETTDTSSKRYVLSNTTQNLINYELRRKMRQVGVQVQDIGTYLCWQTYVDDPGRQLGIAKLVHIAKQPEVGDAPPPESEPPPQPAETRLDIDIPFVPKTEDTLLEDDDAYDTLGEEVETDVNEGDIERIQVDFVNPPYEVFCDRAGYEFGNIAWDLQGHDVQISLLNPIHSPGKTQFGIHLEHVHFHGVSPLRVTAIVTWVPTKAYSDEIESKNQEKIAEFTSRQQYEFQKAFVDAARERIKLASNIEPRKFEDLREEERIVVYRSLVQDMLTKDIPMPDDRTRHVVCELLNTIFDVDKMLYFTAPEWWRPRLHRSHQALGGIRDGGGTGSAKPAAGALSKSVYGQVKSSAIKNLVSSVLQSTEDTQIAPIDTVTWGGTHENRVDNYYITEESSPAKLGSSLGWLLQLDGDNLRNAFLNAPWVKAVIPIRPGKERAAINWLKRVHVEGTDGLDDQYLATPEELAQIPHTGQVVTISDAINHLCDVVAKKHEDSVQVGRYPADEINDDNRVSATPIDKVYEHGFYPLQGGFRVMPGEEGFEVFDQWVEVLPTDQVVPVEVTYDPKTGRQL